MRARDSAQGGQVKPRGTLLLSGSYWLVAADGTTLARLKRWLPRADTRAVGQVKVRSSPEVCADLEAFLERFPLDVDPKHLAQLRAGASAFRSTESRVNALLDGSYTPRQVEMAIELRGYQRVAVEVFLAVRRFLLADQMGLGKSLSAVGMLKAGELFPALIVCPKQVARQWAHTVLPSALPGIRTHILEGTKPYDIVQRAAQQELFAGRRTNSREMPDVLVTTYERLEAWAPVLAPSVGPALVRAMVLDECVSLRHRGTGKYTAAAALSERMEAVIGLDGYPVANYGAEIGNILDLIRPGCLGTPEEFDREWCVAADDPRKKRVKDPVALGVRLRDEGILLRRTAHEVGRELPPMTHVRVPLDGDRSKLDAIRGKAGELARLILDANTHALKKGQAARDLDRLARQATGIAKAADAADFIRGIVEQGERVVVGAWHREVHAVLAEKLKDYAPAFYTGEETDREKAESLRRFLAKDTPILVLSVRSGSGIDGIQYSGCRIVVEVELDWSPAVHDQFRARVARDGQPDPVTVYTLTIDDGSDPTVADVICAKRANSSPVIDPTAGILAGGDGDHLKRLAEAMRGGAGRTR